MIAEVVDEYRILLRLACPGVVNANNKNQRTASGKALMSTPRWALLEL